MQKSGSSYEEYVRAKFADNSPQAYVKFMTLDWWNNIVQTNMAAVTILYTEWCHSHPR